MESIPHPLELVSLFQYRHEANRRFFPVTVIEPQHEVVEVVTGGRGWVRQEGEWREVLPGDLLWHSPGDETIGQSDPKNPYRCFVTTFRVNRAEGMGVQRFSKWPDIEEINLLAKECIQWIWRPSFDRNVLRDYLYAKLLFQVRLSDHLQKETRYPGPVAAVVARIEFNYDHPLRIADLAKETGWSVPHLQAEFLKHVGSTPRQVLIQKRLLAAKGRLASSTDPVKQIAVECGFYDAAALSHVFKAVTGQTPSEFRGNHRRNKRPPKP